MKHGALSYKSGLNFIDFFTPKGFQRSSLYSSRVKNCSINEAIFCLFSQTEKADLAICKGSSLSDNQPAQDPTLS